MPPLCPGVQSKPLRHHHRSKPFIQVGFSPPAKNQQLACLSISNAILSPTEVPTLPGRRRQLLFARLRLRLRLADHADRCCLEKHTSALGQNCQSG